MLVKQGSEWFFGPQRVLITHLEFTDICNRHCSYCLEGNADIHRINDAPSDETKMVNLIEKIYRRIKPTDFMLFIIAGGEPTLQPALKAVIAKIYTRKNTEIMITTNFTQSAAFYRELNVPLITSLHLENNDVDAFLTKVEQLYDLIAHVRVMACPERFEEFKTVYAKVVQLHTRLPLNFACERIWPWGNGKYTPNYSAEYLDFLKTVIRGVPEYPESLQKRLQIAQGIFHVPDWWELIDGQLKKVPGRTDIFTGMHCERNLISIEKSGRLWISWCGDSTKNAFDLGELPNGLFANVVCTNPICYLGFLAALPKYTTEDYAPEYIKSVKK